MKAIGKMRRRREKALCATIPQYKRVPAIWARPYSPIQKVYLVTKGDYSDYRVVDICSTSEKAERSRALVGSNNEVKPFIVDTLSSLPNAKPGYYLFEVDIAGNGDVVTCEQVDVSHYFEEAEFLWTRINSRNVASMTIWARNEDHAIKIANERRGIGLVLGLWKIGSWQQHFPR